MEYLSIIYAFAIHIILENLANSSVFMEILLVELAFVKKAIVLLFVNLSIQLFLSSRVFVIKTAIIEATALLILAIACLSTSEILASLLIAKGIVEEKRQGESATMKRASVCVLKASEAVIASFIVLEGAE